jgi:RimJ/RimL family protein N-acetyltransferase
MKIEAITLEGRNVRLEPLTRAHHVALCAVGLDEELWRWTTTLIRTPEEMRNYIDTALAGQAAGTTLAFAIVEKSSASAIGSTRFADIDEKNRSLEIGWTWIAGRWQRTPINTEAKYLMLSYAFEKLDCLRVTIKTDALNERSRRAIKRLGAKEEGVLRNHMITQTGRIRDTVYYSIIAAEWPRIKIDLEAKLVRPFCRRRGK